MMLLSTEQRFASLVATAQHIPGPMGAGLVNLYRSEQERIIVAPASRKAHQPWPGGYVGHNYDMVALANASYGAISMLYGPLPFLLTDAHAGILLHDIEKPWRYDPSNTTALDTKEERLLFRKHIIDRYSISVSQEVWNAIQYAEGENDDYVAGERKMLPLAALVHSCDIMSARCFPERPRPE